MICFALFDALEVILMEKMTPQQRIISARRGQKPDKLPIFSAANNSFICQYYGLEVEEYLSNADKCASIHKAFMEEFGLDGCVVATGYILYGCGPEMGVTWKFPGEDFPGFIESPLKDENDLANIKVPKAPAGYFKQYLEIIERVSRYVGQTHAVTANILGPFAAACFLRGIEQTLLDTAINPTFFQRYMHLSTELSAFLGRSVLGTGVPLTALNEIFLTPEMISPDAYHRLILPWDEKVQEMLHPYVVPNIMGDFIGLPDDKKSQVAARARYRAFFGLCESLDDISQAVEEVTPEYSFPLVISGKMLDKWEADKILRFLNEGLEYLINDCSLTTHINLVSIQAESQEKAFQISKKLQTIKAFRDEYKTP